MSNNLFPQFKQATFPTAILYRKPDITEPQENTVKYSAPMPYAQPDALPDYGSMPVMQAPALPLNTRDETTPLSFKDAGME